MVIFPRLFAELRGSCQEHCGMKRLDRSTRPDFGVFGHVHQNPQFVSRTLTQTLRKGGFRFQSVTYPYRRQSSNQI